MPSQVDLGAKSAAQLAASDNSQQQGRNGYSQLDEYGDHNGGSGMPDDGWGNDNWGDGAAAGSSQGAAAKINHGRGGGGGGGSGFSGFDDGDDETWSKDSSNARSAQKLTSKPSSSKAGARGAASKPKAADDDEGDNDEWGKW